MKVTFIQSSFVQKAHTAERTGAFSSSTPDQVALSAMYLPDFSVQEGKPQVISTSPCGRAPAGRAGRRAAPSSSVLSRQLHSLLHSVPHAPATASPEGQLPPLRGLGFSCSSVWPKFRFAFFGFHSSWYFWTISRKEGRNADLRHSGQSKTSPFNL